MLLHEYYNSAESQAAGLAALVNMQLQDALDLKGKASMAVAGGKTPALFMQALSRTRLNWLAVTITPTDERVVPVTDPRSNTRFIRENLLQNHAANARFLPLYQPDVEKNLDMTLMTCNALLERVHPLDVCVLGMGDDGHIASLFPQGDQLENALDPDCADLVVAMNAPAAPETRLSLTARAILSSQNIHLLIHGQNKLAVLKEAQSDDDILAMPIRLLMQYVPERLHIHFSP